MQAIFQLVNDNKQQTTTFGLLELLSAAKKVWYKQHTSQATNRPDLKLDILLKSVQIGDDNVEL